MVYRLPPLPALRAFEAAARHLSFKSAADELHVTPGAVSQQIKGLEDYIGKPLFERLTRTVRLTPEGEAMLPKLREGFQCLAAAVEATRAREADPTLVVNAPPSFASRWLMPRLARFTEAHPDISLRMSSSMHNIDSPEIAVSSVVDPRADISEVNIRYGNGDYPGHEVHQIFAPELVAACSPSLLSGEHPLLTPDDLRWHVLIHDDTVPEYSERQTWANWVRMAGVEGIDAQKGPHFGNHLALEAAVDGLGVVLVLKPLIAEAVARGQLVVPFDITVPSQNAYYLVLPEAIADRPAVAAFTSWVLAEAAGEH
ncbi:MAG: transcriptional regulator GcvA [Betaproteobacteria bacterium]